MKDEGTSAKTMVLKNRGSGFFSNFNCVLNNLRHRLGFDGIEAATVEWYADAKFSEFPYGKIEDGNLWLHFFKPLQFDHLPKQRVEFSHFVRLLITGHCAYAVHKRDQYWRTNYHEIYRRYIRVRSKIERQVNEIAQDQVDGRYCVGVQAVRLGEIPTPARHRGFVSGGNPRAAHYALP